jgi:hypothetical protein
MATPGTMLRTTWGQVDATSLSDLSRTITDNITENNIMLWMMGQLGGVVSRGGKTIGEPIMGDDAASAKWYSGYDPLDMTRTDVATAAEYAWKQLACVEQISGLEKFQNSGSFGVIDLWDAMSQRAGITMRRKVSAALLADGSADGGKALIGVQSAVAFDPTNDTYGTLPSASNAFWRNQVSGSTSAATTANAPFYGTGTNLIDALRELIVECTASNDSPDLVITTKLVYLFLLSQLEAKQQLNRGPDRVDEALAQAGFKNIVYMGVPVVWDQDMQPNSLQATNGTATAGQGLVVLNLDYMKMVFGEGYEFTFSDPISPDNQDSISMKCLMYGNLVLSNRKRHGRANFATS